MKRFFCLAPMLLWALVSCHADEGTREAWIPVLEQTGFEHLSDRATEILDHLRAARASLAGHDTSQAEDLDEALAATRVLLFYEIPMTEARQIVYDAGRLYALRQYDDARMHLERVDVVFDKILQHGTPSVEAVIQEARLMMDDLLSTLDAARRKNPNGDDAETSRRIAEKFHKLGSKVNTMAMKADLFFSGAELPDTF